MRNTIVIIFILILTFVMSACALNKTPITAQEFYSKLSELGFNVNNIPEQQGGAVINAIIAVAPSGNYRIRFYEFTTQAHASEIFSTTSASFDQASSGTSSSLNGKNWASRTRTVGDEFAFISFIDTTFIMVGTHIEYRQEILDIMRELGFYGKPKKTDAPLHTVSLTEIPAATPEIKENNVLTQKTILFVDNINHVNMRSLAQEREIIYFESYGHWDTNGKEIIIIYSDFDLHSFKIFNIGADFLNGDVNFTRDVLLSATALEYATNNQKGKPAEAIYFYTDDGEEFIYLLDFSEADGRVFVSKQEVSAYTTFSTITVDEYSIGDTGPGGGIIFYRNPNGFTMTDTGEIAYYLEAAPKGWHSSAATGDPDFSWASREHYPPENHGSGNWSNITGTEAAVGAGRKNTALILTIDSNAPAASACFNYSINGFNDWFLPSIDELELIYSNLHNKGLGGLSDAPYYSSSQNDIYNASILLFYENGKKAQNVKSGMLPVRAIRAF